jgi:hypothetical protein
MPRISKAAANLAVDRVVVDIRSNAAIASTVEQEAVDEFNGWAAHRASALDDNAAYAKLHLLEKYDENNNGYSQSEIDKMSKLGQAFIALAFEMKRPPLLSIADAAAKCDFMSETDSTPTPVSATNGNVLDAFPEVLHETFGPDLSNLVTQRSSAKTFLARQSTPLDPSDDFVVKNAAAWKDLAASLKANLRDLHLIKVGPRDDTTGKLATDKGAYEYFLVGWTPDDKLAGVAFKSVET